jgi:Ras-related GTP-binding protein A/B
MRSIIFANFVARDTSKFSKTVKVETSSVRFLGNLVLNLWDCGGQEQYFLSYFMAERDHIFSNVSVMIFVFDIKSTNIDVDLDTYKKCIESLTEFSTNAKVFVLLHKMDLIPKDQRDLLYQTRVEQLRELSLPFLVNCFQTSIWEETLYKAWSRIVYSLIPNAEIIKQHLHNFMTITEAEEVVLFEKATFLDISHTTQERSEDKYKDGQRFERISNIIKMFKLSCIKSGTALQSMRIHNKNFDAFIYEFTSNTYIMVVVSDPEVQITATLLNIKNAKEHFEQLLKNTI